MFKLTNCKIDDDDAKEAIEALNELHEYACRYKAATQLLQFGRDKLRSQMEVTISEEEDEKYKHWRFMAGRDCAMTAYHFYKTLDRFAIRLKRSSYIQSVYDRAAHKSATKLFRDAFPDTQIIRDAVGHEAEYKDPKRIAKNLLDKGIDNLECYVQEGFQFSLVSSFLGTKFSYTINGSMASVDVSESASEALFEICENCAVAIAAIQRR